MKKGMTALSLALLLGLTACGGQKETLPAPDLGQVEALPPEQTETLEYYLEGEPVELPAVRYFGDGFSIAVPNEGWSLEEDKADDADDFPEVSWQAEVNDDVELEIVTLAGKTLEQAWEWVRTEEDEYTLIEDKQGGLGGSDPEDGDMLEARFYEASDGVFALLLRYPLEASEGFGVTLSVMADTFRLI